MQVLIINGPNLNLLGTREPDVYGSETLDDLKKRAEKEFSKELNLQWFQSNHEGEIVDRIHEAINDKTQAIVMNPGALSHTSVAILDALNAYQGKKIEVHLSYTLKREEFRHKKVTALGADGLIEGLGFDSYLLALNYLKSTLTEK